MPALTKQRVERAVHAAWYGMSDGRTGVVPPELCLPMCVLLQRVFGAVAPAERFHLRLGALNVVPTNPVHYGLGPKTYDPRDSEDTSSGFHAWLESDDGLKLDPSILITLRAHGYGVDDDDFVVFEGNHAEHRGLQLLYEHLPDLEAFGFDASEPALAQQLRKALLGEELTSPITVHLDVRWRSPR